MEDEKGEKALKVRKEEIIRWLKKDYNFVIVLILLGAIAIRLYYLSLTINQPLWWDEGEYMIKARSVFFDTPTSGWWGGRPPLLWWISSVFFLVGAGEFLTRVFIFLLGVCSVYVIYLLGKEISGKAVGWAAACMIGVSWILLFLGNRILMEIPVFFFILLSTYFFIKYDSTDDKKWFYLTFISAILAFLSKWTAGVLFVVFPLLILMKRKKEILKRKHEKVLFVILVLLFIAYAIMSFKKTGDLFWAFHAINLYTLKLSALWSVSVGLLGFMNGFYGGIFSWVIVIGFLYAIGKICVYWGYIMKDKESRQISYMILWFVIFFASFVFIQAWENRFLIPLLIPLSLFIGIGIKDIMSLSERYKMAVIVLLIFVFGVFAYGQYKQADGLIQMKLTTYQELKDMGLWLKGNTEKSDIIISAARPELSYYSERRIEPHEQNLSAEMESIERLNAKYVVISNWEKGPDWIYPYYNGQMQNSSEFVPVHQAVRQYQGQPYFAVAFKRV
jgi:4-amino-4-deoxy-L-arabinose transferase-like glycosyltransferase